MLLNYGNISMKKLLLLLLLFPLSLNSMAKVGDKYYCFMKQFMDITPDKIYQKPLEEFTFLMKEDKIVFTVEKGYFAGFDEYFEMEMSRYRELPYERFFVAENKLRENGVFDDNHFNYTYIEGPLTQQMIARCVKY